MARLCVGYSCWTLFYHDILVWATHAGLYSIMTYLHCLRRKCKWMCLNISLHDVVMLFSSGTLWCLERVLINVRRDELHTAEAEGQDCRAH